MERWGVSWVEIGACWIGRGDDSTERKDIDGVCVQAHEVSGFRSFSFSYVWSLSSSDSVVSLSALKGSFR